MQRDALTEIVYGGFNPSRQALDERLSGTSGLGSCNSLLIGENHSVPFGGFQTKGASTGSRVAVQVGGAYGGLNDIGASLASGSLFEDVGKSLWFIGNGQVSKNGAALSGLIASSALRVSIAQSGAYSALTTYDAGMNQPSAPDIVILATPGAGNTGLIDGAISAKIARLRLSTGGRSRASTTSAVVVPSKKSVRLTFPIASVGQDNWAAFFTQQGFGGVGLHYRAAYNGALDIPETAITRNLTGILINNSVNVTSSTAMFLSSDVGKQLVLSAGNPTGGVYATITAFVSSTSVTISLATTGGSQTVTAMLNSMAGGVARSLEFDFKDGDLVPELAYIDDYPPPAGTHAVRLENVMNVLGCYADTITNPTSVNPGTCIAVSLPNFYESYKPRNLLFLPEQVVSVLSRPSDSYAWVACRNSILTLQYIGLSDAPACTIATAFPNIGIAYPHNWVQFYGRLCLFTTKGSLVIVTEGGNLDESFAAPIKKFIKGWLPADTIVGFDVETNSVVVGNTDKTISYSLDNEQWSDPVYLKDAGIASGNVLSCITNAGKLIITALDGAAATAFDYNLGALAMPIAKVSNWNSSPSRQGAKNIYEVEAAASLSRVDNPIAVVIQRNLRMISARSLSVTNGANTLTSATGIFDTASVGDKVFLFEYDIGGALVNYLTGKIGSFTSPTVVNLQTLAGAALNAQVSSSNVFALFGKYVSLITPARTGEQHLPTLFPLVRDARSYSVAVWMLTNGQTGEFLNVIPYGTVESAALAQVT